MSPQARRPRDLGLLLAARVCSAFGDLVVPVAAAFAVLDVMGGSAADIGVVLAATFAGMLVFLVLSGALADRFPPARVMVASDVLSLTVQTAAAALLATGAMTVPLFAALMFVKGAATAFFGPAAQSVVVRIVGPDEVQRANARLGVASAVVAVAAPLAGGALVAGVGPAWVLAGDAVTFAVSACLILRICPRRARTAAQQPGPAARDEHAGSAGSAAPSLCRELRTGWRELTARRWLWTSILAACALELLGSGPLITVLPVVADDRYGGAWGYAWLMSALGLGSVAGGWVAGRLKVGRAVLAANLMAVPMAVAPLCLALGSPFAVVVGAHLLVGVCQAVFVVLWRTALAQAVPAHVLGRISAWDMVGSFSLRPAGHALGGAAAFALGTGPVLWLGAAAFALIPLPLLAVGEVREPTSRLARTGPAPDPAAALPSAPDHTSPGKDHARTTG
ncbi:MFS transporter [Streptomyces sp. NPDC006733]|uniref:MFS transporter n=1 Tax=Streptomyces sp. NPDC006733 TaxID=3155460 RepID=UPI0033D10CF1